MPSVILPASVWPPAFLATDNCRRAAAARRYEHGKAARCGIPDALRLSCSKKHLLEKPAQVFF